MQKVSVTDRDTTSMNVVAIVFPTTNALLCQFRVGKNVRAKCIINYIVKSKDVKVDGKDKEVKVLKSSELVGNVIRSCDNVRESPSKESYADIIMLF